MPFDTQLLQVAPGQHSKWMAAPTDVTADACPANLTVRGKTFAVKGDQ